MLRHMNEGSPHRNKASSGCYIHYWAANWLAWKVRASATSLPVYLESLHDEYILVSNGNISIPTTVSDMDFHGLNILQNVHCETKNV